MDQLSKIQNNVIQDVFHIRADEAIGLVMKSGKINPSRAIGTLAGTHRIAMRQVTGKSRLGNRNGNGC